jgi:hypothetical protein
LRELFVPDEEAIERLQFAQVVRADAPAAARLDEASKPFAQA